jgi:soluble lytic murein transglycosylase-like protein
MGEIDTKRPYKERVLDSFDRSRIQREVARARGGKLGAMRRRTAHVVLGASLALGGLGLGSKLGSESKSNPGESKRGASLGSRIGNDLLAAQKIAREVTGGVTAAAETLTSPVTPTAVAGEMQASAERVKEKVAEQFYRTEIPFGSLIYQEAKRNNLDPQLVAAVVETESRFKPTARSHAGAQGLMQLVPRTGRWMGARNLMNPSENVKAGTKYLSYLTERFNGDETKIIAAYNAGEGNVRRFGGVPPFRETQNYVRKVRKAKENFEAQVAEKVAEAAEPTAVEELLAR